MVFIEANSADPDEMLPYAAFRTGFHSLPKYLSRLKQREVALDCSFFAKAPVETKAKGGSCLQLNNVFCKSVASHALGFTLKQEISSKTISGICIAVCYTCIEKTMSTTSVFRYMYWFDTSDHLSICILTCILYLFFSE